MACHDTIMNKCADSCTSTSIDQPCGGTVLRCLTEKLDEITDAECKKEVFYFIKMEVRAFMITSDHASETDTPNKCMKCFPKEIVCEEAMSNACRTDMEESP